MSLRQLARNTAVSSAVYLGGSIVGLILVPVLLGTLGAAQFGLYVLAQTTVTYSSLLGGGLNRGFVRALAARSARDTHCREAREVVGTGLSLMTMFGVFIACLAGLIYPLLVRAFHVPSALAAPFAWILWGTVVVYALNLVALPYQGLLIARERLDLSKVIEGLSIVGGTAGSIGAALAGLGLAGVAIALISAAALALAITIFAAARVDRSAATLRPLLHPRVVRELWTYGSRIQLVAMAGMVNRSIDRLSLGLLASPAAVATYDVGDRAAFSLVYAANPLADALAPRMARHLSQDDLDGARATYTKAAQSFALPALLLGAFAVLHGADLIRAWLGSPRPTSAAALAVLATGYAVSVSFSAANVAATAQAVPRLAMRFSLALAVVNVTASLIGAALGGVLGAALGSAIAGGAGSVVYSFLAEKHVLRMRPGAGLRTIIASLAVVAPVALLVSVPVHWAMTTLAPGRFASFLMLGLSLVAQVALTLPIALRLGLLPREQIYALWTSMRRVRDASAPIPPNAEALGAHDDVLISREG